MVAGPEVELRRRVGGAQREADEEETEREEGEGRQEDEAGPDGRAGAG